MTKRLTYNIFNYLTPFMIHVLTLFTQFFIVILVQDRFDLI